MKIRHALISIGLLLVQVVAPAVAQESFRTFAPIAGTTARIIHAAMPAFLQTNLDVSAYRLEVVETSRSYFVEFRDPTFERPKGYRGSSPNRPEFLVELDKNGLQVIGSHFVR
jgi:hypothetical protein